MFSETAKIRLGLISLAQISIIALLSSSAAAQQSVENNIKPAARICLAGQPCVGSSAGGSTASSSTASSAPATRSAPAVQAQVEEVIEQVAEVAAAFDVAASYQMSCFACHGTGAAGAPMLGDTEAWTTRLEKGMDAVMANVVNGVNAMPAKGLCMTCTDDNLRSLVDYMVSQ